MVDTDGRLGNQAWMIGSSSSVCIETRNCLACPRQSSNARASMESWMLDRSRRIYFYVGMLCSIYRQNYLWRKLSLIYISILPVKEAGGKKKIELTSCLALVGTWFEGSSILITTYPRELVVHCTPTCLHFLERKKGDMCPIKLTQNNAYFL